MCGVSYLYHQLSYSPSRSGLMTGFWIGSIHLLNRPNDSANAISFWSTSSSVTDVICHFKVILLEYRENPTPESNPSGLQDYVPRDSIQLSLHNVTSTIVTLVAEAPYTSAIHFPHQLQLSSASKVILLDYEKTTHHNFQPKSNPSGISGLWGLNSNSFSCNHGIHGLVLVNMFSTDGWFMHWYENSS